MTSTTEMQEQEYEVLLESLQKATRLLRQKVQDSEDLQIDAIEKLYDFKKAYNMALLKSEETTEAKRKADAESRTADLSKAYDIAKILASSSKDRMKVQSKTVANIQTRIDIKRSLGAMHRSEAQLAGRSGEA